jgi:DNA-directed RNA polymerase specialized sigma24 family protein
MREALDPKLLSRLKGLCQREARLLNRPDLSEDLFQEVMLLWVENKRSHQSLDFAVIDAKRSLLGDPRFMPGRLKSSEILHSSQFKPLIGGIYCHSEDGIDAFTLLSELPEEESDLLYRHFFEDNNLQELAAHYALCYRTVVKLLESGLRKAKKMALNPRRKRATRERTVPA